MIIYDASSFFERLQAKSFEADAFILDITIYEVGNVILKHHSQLKNLTQDEAQALITILENWNKIIYVRQSDIRGIFSIAVSLKLTFYDAAYVYFSKKYEAILQTCDKTLYSQSQDACDIKLTKT